MAIKGSLAEAALSNVIQLLTISLKSGCLSVTDGKNFGNIFIEDGKIIYATILNRKRRLGDILILKGDIDNNTLVRALDIQKNQKKKRLGEILIELGAITRNILEKELKEQIQQTIFTMLTWDTGYFNFEAGLLPSSEEYTGGLSPQEVLLEAARRIDEWHKIENKMPPFDAILISKANFKDFPLTAQEKKILILIDGRRNIDDLLRLSEFEFFETCKAIYGLLSAGLLEKLETPSRPVSDIAEEKNLGLGFYKTEMYDDAERKFKKVLELNNNDAEALLYLGLIELKRDNYQNAREHFLKALEKEKRLVLLINLGYACNKLVLFDEAINYLNQAKDLAPEDPKVRCNLGIAYYKKGDFDRACDIFKQILEKSREFITAYGYLSSIYLKKGDTHTALSLIQEAKERFPNLSVLNNNLAVIYEIIGKHEESEALYRKALEQEPRNVNLFRNLADFYYEKQILGAARELFEKIPEDKRDWRIFFKLGNIYLRQGDSKQALQFWEQARALNPSGEMIKKQIELLQRTGIK